MTRLFATVALGAVVLAAPAQAETLREALIKAYQGNPSLTAQRAAQRANDENVPIQQAAGVAQANSSVTAVENFVQSNANFLNPERQLSANVQVAVPLYLGGAVRNAVRAAETRVEAGRATLRNVEANVFTNVVAAYMNVIRDEAVVALNTQNVRVLEINLQASRDRFQVGDLTRTDVAQSEARLAFARAQLQSAEAGLISSRENYIAVIGEPAGVLTDPPALPNLPASPDAAVAEAIGNNPQLLAAQRERDATRYDVETAKAQRLPQVNAIANGQYFNFLGSVPSGFRLTSGTDASAGVRVTMPLFQGGRPAALVRQAEAGRAQAIENTTATERAVVSQARSSFAIWRSSQEVIASSEAQVNANKLSLEGVRAENSVGTRTILDILNAEQELLNSQVQLVTARRDAYVAGFALLAAMGDAEAQDLGLDGGPLYDPTVNYRRVRDKLLWDWGGDGEPAPVATNTGDTPAQTAVPARPLDPLLDSQVDRNRPLTTGADSPNRR